VMVYNAEGYKAPYTVTIKKVDTKGNVISTENLSILPGEEYTVSASNIKVQIHVGRDSKWLRSCKYSCCH
ncbi:hypothetical protein, partial [Bacteroides sp. OF04-15BH]|uniref:hypothetical protein n=1 Tax=Bacteroides sp. OF04-15BH TaxID=2292281 RepID=UPI001F26F49C